jgi:uncharacterized membrane protein
MIREKIKNHLIGLNPGFRFRGEEPTRVEAFSDAVFALALTMLLISTKPTRDFNELLDFTSELIPFGLCITAIITIWHEHFIFFLRYGFRNPRVIVMNGILLFIVLFYVYPLKFLATLLVHLFWYLIAHQSSTASQINQMMDGGNVATLMVIYGLGLAAISLMFCLMYRYALRQKNQLGLSALEVFETRVSLTKNILMGSIPLLSVCLALIFSSNQSLSGSISGFTYFLYMPTMMIYGRRMGRRRKKILQEETATG